MISHITKRRKTINPGPCPAEISDIVCPSCHGRLSLAKSVQPIKCTGCDKQFGHSAGIIDLRLFSDRYLSLNQERQKAQRLANDEQKYSLEDLARRYYRMTSDVTPERRERFVRHILDAHYRGHALLKLIPATGKILEIGCGTGGFLQAAAEAGRDVTGVDIASRWLVIARKRLSILQPASNIKIRAACAEMLPFADASFDHVVADSLLEHLEDVHKALSEIDRVLRPGGTAVFWSPNRYWIGPDPHVGLIGLGLLPRSWAEAYKSKRRSDIYLPRLNSPEAWSDCITNAIKCSRLEVAGADFTGWPIDDHSTRGRMARVLGRLAAMPIVRSVMTTVGPVGEIRFVKPVPTIP